MSSSLFELRHLDIMKDGFLTLDAEWNILFINKIAADIIQRENYELMGKNFWETIPSLVGTELEEIFRGVSASRIVRRIQVKRLNTGTWYNLIVFPTATGISIYIEDITKEKLTEEALQQSEQQLKILVENLNFADQSKTAFISTLSHELRNPMASIMLGTSLLRQDPIVGKIANRAIDIIERQSNQLNNLINDLLDVTRITQNKMTINKERIELNHLIGLILEDYKERFRVKGISIDMEAADIPVYLDIDIARFNQVICNLFDNALKFTNPGGIVSISLHHDEPNSKAIITIKDSGIGIKPEIQKQLFKPFVQADLSLDRGFGGLGLGLVIVKGIVEMHGGSVSLHSEGVGTGTTFRITLPLPVEKTIQEAAPCDQAWEIETYGLKILVIDDVADLTEILSEVLRSLGHEVETASEGPQGIALARDFHPDVLLCDIGLPGMNGYEIAEAFRKNHELKNVFRIALSGYAQPEDLERSRSSGYHMHLAKPVNLDRLKLALSEAYFYANKNNPSS